VRTQRDLLPAQWASAEHRPRFGRGLASRSSRYISWADTINRRVHAKSPHTRSNSSRRQPRPLTRWQGRLLNGSWGSLSGRSSRVSTARGAMPRTGRQSRRFGKEVPSGYGRRVGKTSPRSRGAGCGRERLVSGYPWGGRARSPQAANALISATWHKSSIGLFATIRAASCLITTLAVDNCRLSKHELIDHSW
jgi:hypothetical protein